MHAILCPGGLELMSQQFQERLQATDPLRPLESLPHPPNPEKMTGGRRASPGRSGDFQTLIVCSTFLIAITIIACTCISLYVTTNSAMLITGISGIGTVAILQMLGMAKTSQSLGKVAEETETTRHDIKGDLNAVSMQAQMAQRCILTHEQQADERAKSRTINQDDLRRMMEEVVDKAMERHKDKDHGT